MLLRPHSIPARPSRGFSLVELLIATTIGLFVLLGLSMVFLTVKRTFNAQNQLAQLQDEERMVLTVLTNAVQSAGFFPDPTTQTAASALPGTGAFLAGQTLSGSGAAGRSDTLSARYVADGVSIQDCQGNLLAANTPVTNAFSINASNQLVCAVNGGAPAVLAENVRSMTIDYGTDTTNAGYPNQYLGAAAVTSGGLWSGVQSIRITLALANPFAGQAGQPDTLTWIHIINIMGRRSS